MLSFYEWIGISGFILQLFGQFQYFQALFIQKTAKPHAFTWLVWAFIMSIGAFAQFSEGERLALVFLSEGALFCFSVGMVALFRNAIVFTKFDYWCLCIALCIIPLWLVTKTPLYSVILISIIDGMMILPTLRKTWNEPFSEPLMAFFAGAFVYISSLFVLNEISMITAFYPIAIACVNISFISIVLFRRYSISHNLSKNENI